MYIISHHVMRGEYPTDWNSRRRDVYERDEYTCQNCGRKGGHRGNAELHAHHVVPKSKGGTHDLSNLQTVCKQCHKAIHGDADAPTAVESTSTSKYGSRKRHLQIAMLTIWWTGGIGNLAYAAYSRSKYTESLHAKVFLLTFWWTGGVGNIVYAVYRYWRYSR